MDYLSFILANSFSSQAFAFASAWLVETCLSLGRGGGGGGGCLAVVGKSTFGVVPPDLEVPALSKCASAKLGGLVLDEVALRSAFSGAKLGVLFIDGAFSGKELGVLLVEGVGVTAF